MGCFSSSYEPVKTPVLAPITYYATSSHRWISLIQSILTYTFPAVLLMDMEKDIGTDIDAFYQRLIAGKTRLSGKRLSEPELYMYAGIIGLYYGPTSHKFEHITKNLVQYATLELSGFKVKLNHMHTQYTKPIEYASFFDKRSVTIIDDEVTVLLVSNLATGTIRSSKVLEEAKKIASDIALIVVAGDTYYSGTIDEQEKNLLKPLRSVFPHVMVRYILGSHDMYSGPDGMEYVKKAVGQTASYVSIRNRNVVIQGMDTTYREYVEKCPMVRDDELEWHTQCIHEAVQQNKKVVLMSYHEPIRYDKTVNTPLLNQLKPLLMVSDAYLFGHQQHFMLYEDYQHEEVVVKKPRLIGHGGTTSFKNALDTIYVRDGILPGEEWHLRHNGDVMDSGFCILRCKEGRVTVEYYTIHFTNQEHEPAVCVYQEEL